MMKSRSYQFLAIAVLCLATLLASPLSAAEHVFDVVPGDSLGMVIVNRLSATEGKIGKLCDNLQCPLPEPLQQIAEMVQGDTGVDTLGTAALVAMPGQGALAMENGVMLIPVANFDKFMSQFNVDNPGDKIVKAECKKTKTQVLISRKGNYALIAAPGAEDTITACLNCNQSIAATIEPWRGWLQSCDTAAVITSDGLAQFFSQGIVQLEEAKSLVAQGGKQMKPFATVLDAAINQLSSGDKQIRAAAVGVVLEDDGGVSLYNNVLLNPYGEMSEFFAKLPAGRNQPMVGLPKGPFVMAVSGVVPGEMADVFGDLASDLIKASPENYGLDRRQADKLAAASEDMLEQVRGFAMMLSVPQANEPVSTCTHSVLWVKDSRKFLTDYSEQIKAAIAWAKKNGGREAPLAKISARDVQVDNVEALEITVDLSAIISKGDANDGQGDAIKKIYGPTGIMTSYVAAVDANTVVFSYGGKDSLSAAIDAVNNVNDSLAGDSGVRQINRNLLSGGQWVGYWSPSGTIDFVNRMPESFGLAAGPQGQLPPFPTTTPIGMTVKGAATGVVKAVYIPADVVKAVGSYKSMFQDALARSAAQKGGSDQASQEMDYDEPAVYVEEETYESGYQQPQQSNKQSSQQ